MEDGGVNAWNTLENEEKACHPPPDWREIVQVISMHEEIGHVAISEMRCHLVG